MTLFTLTGHGKTVTKIVKKKNYIYVGITTCLIQKVPVMEFRQEILARGLE